MSDQVSLKELRHMQQIFAKNSTWIEKFSPAWTEESQWYLCAVIATDRDKAREFMKSKSVVNVESRRDQEIWVTSDNSRWMWRPWDKLSTVRGYKFHKVAVDHCISKEIFDLAVHLWTPYCVEMEIF